MGNPALIAWPRAPARSTRVRRPITASVMSPEPRGRLSAGPPAASLYGWCAKPVVARVDAEELEQEARGIRVASALRGRGLPEEHLVARVTAPAQPGER